MNCVIFVVLFFFSLPLLYGVIFKVPQRLYLRRRIGVYPTAKNKLEVAEKASALYMDWKYSGRNDEVLRGKAIEIGNAFQTIYGQDSFEAQGTTYRQAMR